MTAFEYRFCCGTLRWRAMDAYAEHMLLLLADFARLSAVDAPAGIQISTLTADELERAAGLPGAQVGYGAVGRKQGENFHIHVAQVNADDPVAVFCQLRQIYYFSLLSIWSCDLMLLHGALAVFNGRGFVFTGQSGMGKSTTMSRLPERWRVLGDDAVLVCRSEKGFLAESLPTWSCGWSGVARQFAMSAAVPLSALLELQRGKTALSPLVGATAFAVVNRASNDLLEQFAFGMDPVEKCEWRKNAFYLAEFLLENTSAYRLNLNLDEDFVQLLENL